MAPPVGYSADDGPALGSPAALRYRKALASEDYGKRIASLLTWLSTRAERAQSILQRAWLRNLRYTFARLINTIREWPSIPLTPTCRIHVDAISFNHDISALTHDAMSIRRNATTELVTPEWPRGQNTVAADSPAAYCIEETAGNLISIAVRFTASPTLQYAYIS